MQERRRLQGLAQPARGTEQPSVMGADTHRKPEDSHQRRADTSHWVDTLRDAEGHLGGVRVSLCEESLSPI